MAWGTSNTEEEAERITVVREYLREQFPHVSIRDSYDPRRMAQVFLIETNEAVAVHTAVVSTEFLEDYPANKIGTVLSGYRVADHLRSEKVEEVVVTTWGIKIRRGELWQRSFDVNGPVRDRSGNEYGTPPSVIR